MFLKRFNFDVSSFFPPLFFFFLFRRTECVCACTRGESSLSNGINVKPKILKRNCSKSWRGREKSQTYIIQHTENVYCATYIFLCWALCLSCLPSRNSLLFPLSPSHCSLFRKYGCYFSFRCRFFLSVFFFLLFTLLQFGCGVFCSFFFLFASQCVVARSLCQSSRKSSIYTHICSLCVCAR